MSRQVNNILGQVLAFAFFVVMGATPLAILALGIVNFIRDRTRRATLVLQALAALAIWTALTFFIVMIFFMTVFEYPANGSQADDLKSTTIYVVGGLIYFLTAGVLIYWTKRQTKRSPAMGVSC